MSSRVHMTEIIQKSKDFINRKMAIHGEKITLHRLESIYSNTLLSEKEKNAIDAFYVSAFGIKIPYDWHRLYKAYSGSFDPQYLPPFIYSGYIEPKWNNTEYAKTFSDKNIQYEFFSNVSGIRVPETYVKRINGSFYNYASDPISLHEAALIISRRSEIVVKKTVNTCSGRDVSIVKLDQRGSFGGDLVLELLKNSPLNCVIQERVKGYRTLQDMYRESLNTFRVTTYIWDGKYHIAPIAMRMGRNGSNIDNTHAGGIMIGVNDDGTLTHFAIALSGERFHQHPDSGVDFSKIRFDFIDSLKAAAIALHHKIPHLGMVSWDLTIDENENIVFIESNTSGQSTRISQITHGCSIFRDNTESILQSIKTTG